MQSFITKITRSEKFSAIPSSKWNEANIRIMNMTMGWNSSHKIFLEISLLRSIQHVPFSYQSQVMIGGMHIQIINSCQSDKTIRFLIHFFIDNSCFACLSHFYKELLLIRLHKGFLSSSKSYFTILLT